MAYYIHYMCCRGTISVADLVTDAIVYPQPLDDWLPQDIKQVQIIRVCMDMD